MESLEFDDEGLLPVVAQDRTTGTVRMVAWMNAEALAQSFATGYATFFSRSRGRLWTKGESSGNKLKIHSVVADCDGDTLLLLVDPVGPSCHTGSESCFFTRVLRTSTFNPAPEVARPFLFELEGTLRERQKSSGDLSYTRSLLDGGPEKIGDKLREEATELAVALDGETEDRVANEAADLLYHIMVGLRLREVELRRVIEVLAGRAGLSGHVEKAGRPSTGGGV